jgi:GDP-4-dehydro-6-deoxy-D-mannose reductase
MAVAQTHKAVEVRVDQARLRPVDEPILCGDNRRLRAVTGWEPHISMEQTVAELLTYWRQRIKDE